MMEGWKEVKLEEIADVVGGGTPSSKEDLYWNGDINWVTPADLSGYMFKHISAGERKLTKLGLSKSSAKLHPKGTVLMTSRAPIGYLAIAGDEVATNQGFQSLRCKTDKVDNNFLYYILHLYKEGIQAIASGATFPEVSGKKVKGFKIKIPTLTTQRKIASILSAYDDLIENNIKRIKLLEEKAQLTYEEWFVRMKFPGHESTPINKETGLPEGWEKKKIGDICTVSGGGTPSKAISEYWDDGTITWFSPTDLSKSASLIQLDSESQITELGLQKSSAKLLQSNSFMMTSRATIGLFGIIDKPFSTNQGFINVTPNENFEKEYLIYNFKYNLQLFINYATGATFLEISKSVFKQIKINWPTIPTIKSFNEIVSPIHKEMLSLTNQNQLLKEARDILLPRLMTGMIDVEKMNLETLHPTTA